LHRVQWIAATAPSPDDSHGFRYLEDWEGYALSLWGSHPSIKSKITNTSNPDNCTIDVCHTMSMNKIYVMRLAHVHYQHPDLDKALSFLKDFGFIELQRMEGRVYLGGYGIQPYVYVAEQSPDEQRHFLGGYWVVKSAEDLRRAASSPGASTIQESHAPGGGQFVTMKDSNGFVLGFVFGQNLRHEEESAGSLERAETGYAANTAFKKPRKGETRRFRPGPSPIHKLGHYGFVVPQSRYEETLHWYLNIMNLKPTDAVFNPETGKDETCFAHIDLGITFTDHHV
jgi:catechol 2,3-dioxygenase-like lactoylglutathione lyase family enzyme